MSLTIEKLGFRIRGLEIRVEGCGFRGLVWSLRYRVQLKI